MKIIVCVKKVPDTESKIKIAADGKSIETGELKYIMNPYDEFSVEEALQLKEKQGGEVVVLCLGGDAEKEIRSALAMGADSAVYLEDPGYNGDNYATAKTLADYLKGQSFDLLLFGKVAVDDGAAAIGPMVAELLGLPSLSAVETLSYEAGKFVGHMGVEGGTNIVELPVPCVLTAEKGLNVPRYPSVMGIMKAKKKPLEKKPTKTALPKFTIVKLQSPPPRPPGKIVGKGVEAVPQLVDLLRNEAKVI